MELEEYEVPEQVHNSVDEIGEQQKSESVGWNVSMLERLKNCGIIPFSAGNNIV